MAAGKKYEVLSAGRAAHWEKNPVSQAG